MKKYALIALALLGSQTAFAESAEMPLFFGDSTYPIPQNILILDSNDTGGDVVLQFGETLAETLFWDSSNEIFTLTKGLNIQGNLDVTGDTALLPSPASEPSDSSFDNSQWSLWLDEANQEFELKAKDSSGNILTQTVGSGSSTISPLSAAQVRREGGYTLSSASTWYDVPFTINDVLNDTSTINHSTTSNTERIYIYADGLYGIAYQAQSSDSSVTHYLDIRVQKNGSTVIPGSELVNNDYRLEHVPTTSYFLAELNAGDYITLQVMRTTSNALINDTVLSINKLDGVKGEKGDPGSGGEASYTLGQFYDSAGSQNANASSGTALAWGAETRKDTGFTHSTSSNSSRVYLDAAGWYKVAYNVSYTAGVSNTNVLCRIRLDGSSYITPSASYSYNYRSGYDSTNNASALVQTTSANQYYEIVCSQAGSSGTSGTISGASWTTVEKIN